MALYNAANSLSPMMFKKAKKKDKEGTRNERWRSKSMELLYDVAPAKKSSGRRATGDAKSKKVPWKEVASLKGLGPVVTCVLPSLAMDFVASSLLAVGATPLITEDPGDMAKDLSNCKAVVVDVSAPQCILEAFVEQYNSISLDIPYVLVASNCGANDRKKELMLSILEDTAPTVITGRLGDIVAVAQSVIEKNCSPLDSISDSDSDVESSCSDVPKVVLHKDSVSQPPDITSELPPVMRRAKFRKVRSPPSPPAKAPIITNGCNSLSRIRSDSPRRSASPINRQGFQSPKGSPRGSPISSPRGVKKKIEQMKNIVGSLERVPTALPRMVMRGQFRETQMKDISIENALEYAQKLSVYSTSYIHLYETNVVTSGEEVVEISNTQIGMGNLHSTLPCSAAIMSAVLACVDLEDNYERWSVMHCAHGLAFFYVAAEEAGANASGKGLVSPGTLRQVLIDALHSMDEPDIHGRALIQVHSQGLKRFH